MNFSNILSISLFVLIFCYVVDGKLKRDVKGSKNKPKSNRPALKGKGPKSGSKSAGSGGFCGKKSCCGCGGYIPVPGQPGPAGIQGIQGVQGVQGPGGQSGIPGIDGRKGDKGMASCTAINHF